jgi:hypothetical protein
MSGLQRFYLVVGRVPGPARRSAPTLATILRAFGPGSDFALLAFEGFFAVGL